MKKMVIAVVLLCILNTGCITEKSDSIKETNSLEEIPIIIPETIFETPEFDKLIQFLEEDKTDEIVHYNDPKRGKDYFVCTGYTRALAKNASGYNITMGAIGIRDHEHIKTSKFRHAMNYVIIDDKFLIIEPQDDWVYNLNEMQYMEGNGRYITIYPNVEIMTNFGKHKYTINIDLRNYNETELVEIWNNK